MRRLAHEFLFDTFTVKIKGNQFVTDAQIQKQLQPFMEETYFSISLNELQIEIPVHIKINTIEIQQLINKRL